MGHPSKYVDIQDVLKEFTFINYLDFIREQSFSNKQIEYAFKELFYRVVNDSGLFATSPDFIKIRSENERKQVKFQNLPSKKLIRLIKKSLFRNKIDYVLLLHFELLYLCLITGIKIEITTKNFWSYFDYYSDRKKEKIWKKITNFEKIKIQNGFHDVSEFISSRKKYRNQKIFNIAVCATMSAGKSTFVNALLGNDYLPARNEATTAKITSIYDNDAQKKMVGFSSDGQQVLNISDDLSLVDIDKWNADERTKRIYLQADLDSICSDKVICAVHDTPGTNNSADSNHQKITMDFLTKNKIDLLIFIANVTQLKTTDERKLLNELYLEAVMRKNISVLFVLNKIDELDEEKEEMQSIIKSYKNYIEEIGFKNSKILPVSAKAARLFKMVLKGKAQKLTKKELSDFNIYHKIFSEYLDINSGSSLENVRNIIVGKNSCNSTELKKILEHTGISEIEKTIKEFILD